MPWHCSRLSMLRVILPVLFAACLASSPPALAEGLRLKNGLALDGKLVPIQGLTAELIRRSGGNVINHPIWMVHNGMQRIFVPDRQVAEANTEPDLARWETFKLPPHKREGRQQMVAQLGSFVDVTEFDKYGRRRVRVLTPQGTKDILQGITTVGPRYVAVEGLDFLWESGLATSSFRPEVLDAILRQATDPANPNDRLAIARFYVQAEMYSRAAAELDLLIQDFPDWKDRASEILITLRTQQARQLLDEIRRRMSAGQYQLAWNAVRQFPQKDMSASVLRAVVGLEEELIALRDRREHLLMRLGDLQADVEDDDLADRLRPLRSLLREQLDIAALPRLDAFGRLEADNTLSPEQRLALAYSGWIVGSTNAVTDLDQSLRLWQAQFLVREYLRTESSQQKATLLSELDALEGVGAERIGQMVPLLPPLLETPGAQPSTPFDLEAPGPARADSAVKYTVLLPPEYSSNHSYPMIVALRPPEITMAVMTGWWGGDAAQPGQAQRHGYIVIAPEYSDLKSGTYDHSAAAHDAVEAVIRDARKRFSVDSDRIFLAGHGAGADAALDIGMSRPHHFAGVIAVNGLCDKYCTWYWRNAKRLPLYIVGGELSRGSLSNADHARNLNRMMQYGYDIIYAEFIGRGYESYYSEIHRLFQWMELQRRTRFPQEFSVEILRPNDDRFYWVEARGLPASALQSMVIGEGARGPVKPMSLTVKIADASDDHTSIYLTSGAEHNTLWLSPELVSFDKRLNVSYRGRRRYSDFPVRDLATMLDDLQIRGDRQMLYWAKVEIR